MRSSFLLFAPLALSLSLAMAAACGGTTAASSTASSSCGDYFDALFTNDCTFPATYPADALARERSRFQSFCVQALALPGSGLTASNLEQCAQTVKMVGCVLDELPPVCQPAGSLAAGVACNDDMQCQSSRCTHAIVPGDAGTPTTASPCGTCGQVVPVGGACGSLGQGCVQGAACDYSNAMGTCVSVAYGDTGASCGTTAKKCKAGLRCNSGTMTCGQLAAQGAACGTTTDCAAGLLCANLTCQPGGGQGTPCGTAPANACATGFGCAANGTCEAYAYVTAGQACDGAHPCTVGSCAGSVCPNVIPDGKACSADASTGVCDLFSDCIAGTCQSSLGAVCM